MQEFDTPFGKVHTFESNDKFGSSILLVEVRKEITKHYHEKIKETGVILEGEIVCGGKIQKPGDINIWEVNQIHGYKNESDSPVKIL